VRTTCPICCRREVSKGGIEAQGAARRVEVVEFGGAETRDGISGEVAASYEYLKISKNRGKGQQGFRKVKTSWTGLW
jgi:hypothetical protein